MGEEQQVELIKEVKEIKTLLKRLVYLFEQYDAQVFEDEEVARELQNGRSRGKRR